MPRQPSTIATSTSGTNSARIGVCLPTIAPRVSLGSSVTLPSVRIGVAIAPNATGAVLAVSASAAALSGLNPSAISITDVTATGVPNPASASSSAPNENAMMTACTRWSSLTRANERRKHVEMPCLDGHLIDPDRVDHDPQDREEPEGGAFRPGEQGLTERHPVHQDREHDRECQRHQRRHPGRHPQHTQHHEQQQQRQRRDQRAPRQGMRYRIENLLVHGDHLAGTAIRATRAV